MNDGRVTLGSRVVPGVPGLRPVRDADAAGLIDLIGGAYAEYPGCVLDLDGVDDDLLTPATSMTRTSGRLWVVDHDDTIAACIGAGPLRDDTVELKRLYVARTARRQGLGSQLISFVEDHAAGVGAQRIELWSDLRFTDAHRLYERLGYEDTGARRQLHDPSCTTERQFTRDLPGR